MHLLEIFTQSLLALANSPPARMLDWDVSHHDKYITIVRLGLAAIMGGLLGWERGRAEKPVGIRTMLLISTGAAAFALLGQQIIATSSQHDDIIRADPTRVLSYIISGVGFLGAGAILHSKRTVKGLTTAASIWVSAAIGAACGLGEYMIGFFLFAIAYVALWGPWVKALADGTLNEEQIDTMRGNDKKS